MYSKISVTLSLDSIEGVECVDVVGPTLQEILCFLGEREDPFDLWQDEGSDIYMHSLDHLTTPPSE